MGINKGKLCAIEDCKRTAEKRGYCGAHYYRLRVNGHPLAGRTQNGLNKNHIEIVLKGNSKECIFWPFPRNNNGYARISGVYVHRTICERAHGAAPSSKHQAAHSCGKGNLGCVNPRHLRWATARENSIDRRQHGTSIRGTQVNSAKLAEEDVLSIRRLYNKVAKEELAKRFNVTAHTIYLVQSRRTWSWLK